MQSHFKNTLARWSALLFFLPLVGQTPPLLPRLYSYYKLPVDTVWTWQSVVIDSPSLSLYRDAAGQVHITGPNFADAEVPVGDVDGVNLTYTVAHTPNPPTSVRVYINGLRQALQYYSVAGNNVTFTAGDGPQANDQIWMDYRF